MYISACKTPNAALSKAEGSLGPPLGYAKSAGSTEYSKCAVYHIYNLFTINQRSFANNWRSFNYNLHIQKTNLAKVDAHYSRYNYLQGL